MADFRMKTPSEILSRVRAVFTKPALDADFDAELAQHLEAATADNIRSGMTPPEPQLRHGSPRRSPQRLTAYPLTRCPIPR
jgi:hypothetical protein